MQNDPVIGLGTLWAFLLVLTRITSVFVFVPFPGGKAGPDIAKLAVSLCVTLALFPMWKAPAHEPGFGELTGWMIEEAAFGLMAGLAVSFVLEGFGAAAQMISLQAGFSYASTIDPTTQADSGVLQMIIQMIAGLLFFSAGLDQAVIRIFARSLEVYPPGAFHIEATMGMEVVRLGSIIFSTGLRLAMPIIALLLLVDFSLALLGRINSQLQLLALAMPAKMAGSLAAMAGGATLLPFVFERSSREILSVLLKCLR